MSKLLGMVMLFFLPLAVWAVKPNNFYYVTVPVMSQMSDQRDQAEQDGFLSVLVKLTGDDEINKNPIIKSGLRRAEYYVKDFSYSPPSPDSSEYLIQIIYDKADIKRLLDKAGVPYWGSPRPLALAWIIKSGHKGQLSLLGSDESNPLYKLIKGESKRLGMALIFPVLDMAEINDINMSDIKNRDLIKLRELSKRYAPDVLLIAQLEKTGSQYTGEWQLVRGTQQWSWNTSGQTEADMIKLAMNQVSLTLVRQSTKPLNQPAEKWVKLQVLNVNGQQDLTAMMQVFRRFAPVQQVHLSQVHGDTVDLYILIRGTSDNLLKLAVTNQRLVLKSNDSQSIVFEWIN